jgi:hypothetical protein
LKEVFISIHETIDFLYMDETLLANMIAVLY